MIKLLIDCNRPVCCEVVKLKELHVDTSQKFTYDCFLSSSADPTLLFRLLQSPTAHYMTSQRIESVAPNMNFLLRTASQGGHRLVNFCTSATTAHDPENHPLPTL